MQWTEKYRPKCLDDIVGQSETVTVLRKMMANGGLLNSILYGPPGTGKTTTIHAIVEQLLGNSAAQNFTEMNASDERTMDAIRLKVIQASRYMPLDATKPRIIFLDEADGLTRDIQEVLRKPLERDNSRTIVFLASNTITRFTPALMSRLIHFEFVPLTVQDMETRLKHICITEKAPLKQETITAIAVAADGDIRHAINELQKAVMLL